MPLHQLKHSRLLRAHAVRGFALIVALVLLLVMTMIAVIAMRSTSLDLKMTTNNALTRRAFQSSESLRENVGPLLASLSYYGDWPVGLGGNEPDGNYPTGYVKSLTDTYTVTMSDVSKVPATAGFTLADLNDTTKARSSTPDATFSIDVNGDGVIGQEDIKTAVWFTKTGSIKGGPRVPGAGVGNYAFEVYSVRARGLSAGGAQITTESDFRVYINTH